MDPKVIALLSVTNAAALALFKVHPEPERLREEFSKYIEVHMELFDADPRTGAYQQTWTDAYLAALKR